VQHDAARRLVHWRRFARRLGHRQAALQVVHQGIPVALFLHEAISQRRAQVGQVRELRGVVRAEHQVVHWEAQADAASDHGCSKEVRVDAGLGGVVVGQFRVEP